MVAAAIPLATINIRSFPQNGDPNHTVNGFRTQNFHAPLSNRLQEFFNQDQLQGLNECANCFSQAISVQEPFSNQIASALKTKFLILAHLNPAGAQRVLKQAQFANSGSPEMKDLIKRLTYYNQSYLGKFAHHLHGGLAKDGTATGKAVYPGITLIGTGLATLYADPSNPNNAKAGFLQIALGAGLTLIAIVHTINEISKGEP